MSVGFSPAQATECPGDINGDLTVGISDFLQLLQEWGCSGCTSDINGNGTTDIQDMLALLNDWGCVASGPVSTLSGTVTNLWTGQPVAGAGVQVGQEQLFADASGHYSGDFAPGPYDVLFTAEHFLSSTQAIILEPDLPLTLDAQLEPAAAVIVEVIVPANAEPGDTANATANVQIYDGSTIQGYAWTQAAGADAQIAGADTPTVTLTLGSRFQYKEHLFQVLSEPPIAPEQFPPYVPLPSGEFAGGLQNRFEIAGVNHLVLEDAGLVRLAVDVTTTSGTWSAEGEVHTHIPWKPSAGIRDVPVNVPVLLHGKTQASYDWVLDAPNGSLATLLDAGTPFPDFTPDVPGLYQVMVSAAGPGGGLVTLQIHAGHWRGVIVGQDADGRPVADKSCTGCHSNLGHDAFTPWSQTGHAEIFTNNLNTNTNYSQSCFGCHSVGFDPDSFNNGFDDAYDYQDFLASGLINQPGDNWTTMLEEFPWSAQQANAQCENCHGPQWGMQGVGTLAHSTAGPVGEPRVSLSASVCGQCHGEPLRHARYQQWQLSAHANYEIAMDEGTSGSCSRCHTVNGFLAWLPVLTGEAPGDPLASVTVTWTVDEVHPQTCVTCHDPHDIGTVSGDNNNATMRISGDTPPLLAGFQAVDVGRGAMCITCHNSRNGPRNDAVFDQYYGTSEAARAPHGSAQGDMLMGENAYLVPVGMRGGHSFLTDSCTQCHMVQTQPPAALSHNFSGTNHTFYASTEICANCHTDRDAPTVQGGVQETLDLLRATIEEALFAYIDEQTTAGHIVDLNGAALITDAAQVTDIMFTESSGRHAMKVTLTNGSTVGPVRMTDVRIRDGSMAFLGFFYDFADPNLIKAGWNWLLVDNDGTLGVHNPSFAYELMGAAIDALDPGAAASINWPSWATPSAPPAPID